MIFYCIIVSFFLLVCIFYLYKFSKAILKLESAIEESLDILDENYKSINEILKIPILYDSKEVRRSIEIIKKSRDSILKVAQIISISVDEENSE